MSALAAAALLLAADVFGVSLTPRIGFAPQDAQIRVRTNDPAFYCPEVEVEWGDDSLTTQQGDCEPEEKPDEFRWSRWHRYRVCSDEPLTAKVTLSQGGKRRVGKATILLRCQ